MTAIELAEEDVRRYENGESQRDIATRYGCSREGIRAALLRAGVARRKTGGRRIDLDTEILVAMYQSGSSLKVVGAALGVSGATVGNRLAEAGVAIRKGGSGLAGRPANNRVDLPVDAIVSKYTRGRSAIDIAEELGVSNSSILNRLRDAGIPIRPKGVNASSIAYAEAALLG